MNQSEQSKKHFVEVLLYVKRTEAYATAIYYELKTAKDAINTVSDTVTFVEDLDVSYEDLHPLIMESQAANEEHLRALRALGAFESIESI